MLGVSRQVGAALGEATLHPAFLTPSKKAPPCCDSLSGKGKEQKAERIRTAKVNFVMEECWCLMGVRVCACMGKRGSEAMDTCDQPLSSLHLCFHWEAKPALRTVVNLLTVSRVWFFLLPSCNFTNNTHWTVSMDDNMGRQCCLQAMCWREPHALLFLELPFILGAWASTPPATQAVPHPEEAEP